MVSLPSDLMLDICVRLPAKSVGRFRCTNKAWYKRLNDRKFLQKHLDHATETNRLSLMLYSWDFGNRQGRICTINYDPSSSTFTGCVNKNLPFVVDKLELALVGHCNGMVCLKPYNMRNLFLWNPSSNEYKILPEAPLFTAFKTEKIRDSHLMRSIEVGFGYDYKTGEFKVVIVAGYAYAYLSEVQGSAVYLYTLGSNTWITLESIPHTVVRRVLCRPGIAQVPVNGVVHWEALRERGRVILSFNFETEIFQEMSCPDLLSGERTYLFVFGGSLCICNFDSNIGVVEMWEFKGSEVTKSWNKLFTIDIREHFGPVIDFVPLQSLRNDEFLFGLDTNVGFHVHQYDLKHETSTLLYIHENSRGSWVTTAVYIESLLTLNPGNYVDENNHEDDNDDADIWW